MFCHFILVYYRVLKESQNSCYKLKMTQREKCFLCNLLKDLEFEEHQNTIKHLAATHNCTQSFKCKNCENNNFHTDLAKSTNSNPNDQPISEDKNLDKVFVEIKKTSRENEKPSLNSNDIVEFVEKIEAEMKRKFRNKKSKNNQIIDVVDLTLDVDKILDQSPKPTKNPDNKTESNTLMTKNTSTPKSDKKSSRKQIFPSNDNINSPKNQHDELTFECIQLKNSISKKKPSLYTETPIKTSVKKSGVNTSKSVCPVCNKLIPDSLITVHANQCLEKPTLRKQFSEKEQKTVDELESILNTCEKCNEIFSSKENLKMHVKLVHEEQKNSESASFKEKNSKTESILKIKSEKHDEAKKKAKQFNCHDCSKTFVSKQGLSLHIKVHETNFKCKFCDTMYIHKSQLKKHNKECTNYKCKMCDKEYGSKVLLNQHIDSVHDGLKFSCKFCDQNFTTQYFFDKHIKNMHGDIKIDSNTTPVKAITQSQFFSCKLCTKKFSHKNYLNDHIRNKHVGMTKNESNKTMEDKTPIKTAHEGINAEKNEKIIPKKHLGIRIKTVHEMNSTLIGHKEQNNSEFKDSNSSNSEISSKIPEVIKDQKCDLCSESFAKCHELKNHIKSAHGGEKKFKCLKCENSYSNSSYLSNHMQIMHENAPPEASHKCEVCDKSFMFKHTLANHIRNVHQRGKAEKCEKCGKSFFTKYDKKKHIAKVHEGKKGLFECDYCGETFARKPEQEVHLKEIHQEVKIN